MCKYSHDSAYNLYIGFYYLKNSEKTIQFAWSVMAAMDAIQVLGILVYIYYILYIYY